MSTLQNERLKIKKITYSALFLALAQVLPFLTGQIPQIGAMLCPMHIPALLCGFVCGWPWGLAVGMIAPMLRSVLFGMPKLFPTAIAMMFELGAYGLTAGLLFKVMPSFKGKIYAVLLSAMVLGRIVWGIAQFVLLGISQTQFTPAMFLAGAITNAVPGIILHIVIIPPIVALMKKAGLMLN